MADDFTTVDLTNPCAAAALLRTAYYGLISGAAEQKIRFRNGETEEEVWFTPAKVETLRAEMLRQEAKCAAQTSGRPGRFCFTAG
jgi:hypothetical protein